MLATITRSLVLTAALVAGAGAAAEVKVFQVPEGAGPHDVAPAPDGSHRVTGAVERTRGGEDRALLGVRDQDPRHQRVSAAIREGCAPAGRDLRALVATARASAGPA